MALNLLTHRHRQTRTINQNSKEIKNNKKVTGIRSNILQELNKHIIITHEDNGNNLGQDISIM